MPSNETDEPKVGGGNSFLWYILYCKP